MTLTLQVEISVQLVGFVVVLLVVLHISGTKQNMIQNMGRSLKHDQCPFWSICMFRNVATQC